MFATPPPPPADEAELLRRAHALAGRPLSAVAARFGLPVPADLSRHKGWQGQLLETALGATASSRAQPDFPHLHVELKTLPVRPDGRPRESTYVCTAPLDGSLEPTWEDSWVRRKLSRVLWVPIVSPEGASPADRVVGTAWLWVPTPEDDDALRADWEEFARLITLGELWHLDARHGRVLQLRPKAANRRATTTSYDEDGREVAANPRGFYLRAGFTAALLARALRTPS